MRDTPLPNALAAEAIGTFALVFAGCGAVMVDAKTGALGHTGVAATFGLVIMVMIYAVGHVSGAHFNPAVSFAFALTRHFPWTRTAAYWGAQAAGALVAAGVLRSSLGPAFVSGEVGTLWIYVAAPLCGAAVGALAYQLVRGEKQA